MILAEENWRLDRKCCPTAEVSDPNLTWTGLCNYRLVTNCLRHGMIWLWFPLQDTYLYSLQWTVYNLLFFIIIWCKDKGAGIAHSFKKLGYVLDNERIVIQFSVEETLKLKKLSEMLNCINLPKTVTLHGLFDLGCGILESSSAPLLLTKVLQKAVYLYFRSGTAM